MEQTTYRIVAFYGFKEKTLLRGLTEAEAREKLAFYQARPMGMSYCIETEKAAQQWEKSQAGRQYPHPVKAQVVR